MKNSLQHKILSASLCAIVLLAGCKVGPDYHLPTTEHTASNWIAKPSDSKAEIEQHWWEAFHDPLLEQCINKALAGNWDLKIAESRIAEARAAKANATSDLLPVVNTDASAERQSNRLAIGSVPFDLAKPFNTFQTGFDASWELDLFGGKRRALESAGAELQAAEATRDDARISLLAEVARTYVDIRQYQAQIAIAKDTLANEDHVVKIAHERFKAGDAPGLDVTQAESQQKQVAAQFPYYQNLLQQAELNMDLLLGEPSGATQALVTASAPIPMVDSQLVLAAPAKVIASRPDIRVAERKLASATAEQGVAVAQFFPDISLSGFLGFLSADSNDLLRRSSKSWDIGGNLVWPILNYGKLSSNLHASDARAQEALAQYQKSILAALSDVERSTASYMEEGQRRIALDEVGASDQHAVVIAQARYKQGLSSFIEVLDAQRTLYTAQSQAAASRALESQNLIGVYKSLGGGWEEDKPAITSPTEVPSQAPAK